MKKILLLMTLVSGLAYGAEYRDGTYRGVYVSGQETQVEVQFNLKNDKVTKAKYRTLYYKGKNYLKDKELVNYKDQYEAALKSTINQEVEDAVESLYTPEKIEKAGATIRSTKIRAAIQNALNSGVYKLAK